MASSDYYYSQMCSYSKSKRLKEEKKKEYENYIEKLKKIKNDIPIINQCLNNSSSTFRNGGYYDGDTPDRGNIKSSVAKLENASNIIDNVIIKTNEKISEFFREIVNYTNLYNEAHYNYEIAKKAEQK